MGIIIGNLATVHHFVVFIGFIIVTIDGKIDTYANIFMIGLYMNNVIFFDNITLLKCGTIIIIFHNTATHCIKFAPYELFSIVLFLVYFIEIVLIYGTFDGMIMNTVIYGIYCYSRMLCILSRAKRSSLNHYTGLSACYEQ